MPILPQPREQFIGTQDCKPVKILGWYGNKNTGDESYKIAFSKLFPGVEFVFSDSDSFNCACNTCVFGGGNILDSLYIEQILKIPTQKRLAISVSANQKTPFDILKKLDGIFVRDKASHALLADNHITSTWMPDISLCLQPNVKDGTDFIKQHFQANKLDLYSKKVGIVLNAYLYYKQPDVLACDFLSMLKLVFDIARLADNTSASFIFFPMGIQVPSDDRITNFMAAGRCKFWKKNTVIADVLDVQQTLTSFINTRRCSSKITARWFW